MDDILAKINMITKTAEEYIHNDPKFIYFGISPDDTESIIWLYRYEASGNIPEEVVDAKCRDEVEFIKSILDEHGWYHRFKVTYAVVSKNNPTANILELDLQFEVNHEFEWNTREIHKGGDVLKPVRRRWK